MVLVSCILVLLPLLAASFAPPSQAGPLTLAPLTAHHVQKRRETLGGLTTAVFIGAIASGPFPTLGADASGGRFFNAADFKPIDEVPDAQVNNIAEINPMQLMKDIEAIELQQRKSPPRTAEDSGGIDVKSHLPVGVRSDDGSVVTVSVPAATSPDGDRLLYLYAKARSGRIAASTRSATITFDSYGQTSPFAIWEQSGIWAGEDGV